MKEVSILGSKAGEMDILKELYPCLIPAYPPKSAANVVRHRPVGILDTAGLEAVQNKWADVDTVFWLLEHGAIHSINDGVVVENHSLYLHNTTQPQGLPAEPLRP